MLEPHLKSECQKSNSNLETYIVRDSGLVIHTMYLTHGMVKTLMSAKCDILKHVWC